jgi:ubiquinone/menaquinone biosynthesis C-methylase UbiE
VEGKACFTILNEKGRWYRIMSQAAEERTYHNQLIEEALGFTHVRDRSVLVVGCGRGKECELIRQAGAREVIGIDCGKTLGKGYPHPAIKYVEGFAEDLPFRDGRFNVVTCCATLEHVRDPEMALREMIRVTASRGIIYCYADPLWNSPFGHHKKSIFPNDPWLHLRFDTVEQIMEYFRARSGEIIDGAPLEDHVKYMMERKHLNKFSIQQYKEAVGKILSLDVNPIHISAPIAYRLEELLTPALRRELKGCPEAELFTSSVKIVLRKH